MSTEVSCTVYLAIKTCYSGHVYAVINWVPAGDYTCPICGKERIDALRERLEKSEASNTAYRGVITRLKGKPHGVKA